MDLRNELKHFRAEHDEILRFLREWQDALALAGDADSEARRTGLSRLLELDAKLLQVRAHCREEEQSIESPFRVYLDEAALDHLHGEHNLLDLLSDAFRDELHRACAPPPTTELMTTGIRLLEQLRHHIAYEEGLLKQIEDGNAAEQRAFLRCSTPIE